MNKKAKETTYKRKWTNNYKRTNQTKQNKLDKPEIYKTNKTYKNTYKTHKQTNKTEAKTNKTNQQANKTRT